MRPKATSRASRAPHGEPPAARLRQAQSYLELGWSVIPVEPGGKRPLVRWEAFQHKRASERDLRRWLRRWPDANVGIVTGAISGLLVLDVDPRHGGDRSLAGLEHRHGPLPDTVESVSGGGGRHVYFAHPGGIIHNRAALVPGIDLRGDGGMIVVPPSRHPSGRDYAWRASHGPDMMTPAPLPPWLLVLLQPAAPQPGHPAAHWRGLVRNGVAAGERNNTIASLTGHLLWREVDLEVIKELLLCWNRARCRPPLSDDEVVSAIESIRRTHERQAVRDGAPGSCRG